MLIRCFYARARQLIASRARSRPFGLGAAMLMLAATMMASLSLWRPCAVQAAAANGTAFFCNGGGA
jgi:hypothetical protein